MKRCGFIFAGGNVVSEQEVLNTFRVCGQRVFLDVAHFKGSAAERCPGGDAEICRTMEGECGHSQASQASHVPAVYQ